MTKYVGKASCAIGMGVQKRGERELPLPDFKVDEGIVYDDSDKQVAKAIKMIPSVFEKVV